MVIMLLRENELHNNNNFTSFARSHQNAESSFTNKKGVNLLWVFFEVFKHFSK